MAFIEITEMKRLPTFLLLLFGFWGTGFADVQDPNAIAAYLSSQLPSGRTPQLGAVDVRKALQDIYDTVRSIKFEYKGTYNVATNSPSLVNGVGTKGDTYRISTGGVRDFGAGNITFGVDDEIYYNGTVWVRRNLSGGGSNYKGLYEAAGNIPTIADSTSSAGDIYFVDNVTTSTSVSGVLRNLGVGGDLLLFTGDLLVHDGAKFRVVPAGRNRESVISLDWFPFTRGLGVTAAESQVNSDLLETVKNIAADVTNHSGNVGVIQLTGSGPYEFSDTIDNLLYGVGGTTEVTANYGTLTYSVVNNTLTRSTGTWSAFTANRHIKIRDVTNPSNSGMFMIVSISGSTMQLRRDSDGPGSDDGLKTAGTSTTASLTPFNTVANRVSLSLIGNTVGGWVLHKRGSGTAVKRHSHFSNNWTTARTPGGTGVAANTTYFSYDLNIDGVEIVADDGYAIWVESGDAGAAWHIGSVRAKNIGTAQAAVLLDETFAGTITDLYVNWTGGDGIQCNTANAVVARARIEGAGGAGLMGSGYGSAWDVNIERCKGYGVDMVGNFNTYRTYLEGNNSGTQATPGSPNNDASTAGAVPEIRVSGRGNTVFSRIISWTGNGTNDPQFLNPIDLGDIAATYTTVQLYTLPPGFDMEGKAKAWPTSPWASKKAYLSLDRIAAWQRKHFSASAALGVTAFNYPDGGSSAGFVGDKLRVVHAVGAHNIAGGSTTRTVKWLDSMLGSTTSNGGDYDKPVTTVAGVAGNDLEFNAPGAGGAYAPSYVTRFDLANSWIADGWKEGMKLVVTNSAANNITCNVVGVSRYQLFVDGTFANGFDEDATFSGSTGETGTNLATLTVDPGDVIFYRVRYSTNQWSWFRGMNSPLSGMNTSPEGGQIPLLVLGWGAVDLAQEFYVSGPGIQEVSGYREVQVGSPTALALNAFHLVTCTEVSDAIHGAGAAAASPAAETWIHSLELSISDNAWNDN